jgi:hypothetical protein
VDIRAAFQGLNIFHGVKKKGFVVRVHGNPPATSGLVLYLHQTGASITPAECGVRYILS